MPAERREDILHKRAVTFAFAPVQQFLSTPPKAFRTSADRIRIKLPHVLVALKTQALRQPRHRRRRNAGAARLLARGQERNFSRVIDHPACGFLEPRRQTVEIRFQPAGESRILHANF